MNPPDDIDAAHMRAALRLAQKGYGYTSPNPMVGALLVKGSVVIGQGWHRRAGGPHAEVAAIRQAQRKDYNTKGATLYVTLEPCCTTGRTPPCTEAIVAAGIRRIVVGTTDPNPEHAGRGFRVLKKAGLEVRRGVLRNEAEQLIAPFAHWMLNGTPWVTVKAAMTLDGKIATEAGQSKWITSEAARREGMRLRKGADAILVGSETVLADDPSLTVRGNYRGSPLRRIVLDSRARTPLDATVVQDAFSKHTVVVANKNASKSKLAQLRERITVWTAPMRKGHIDLKWLLKRLGKEGLAHLLVEGGGEVNASFIQQGLAHEAAFFYAPKILGGGRSRRAVGGEGTRHFVQAARLVDANWKRLGPDLMLTARVAGD